MHWGKIAANRGAMAHAGWQGIVVTPGRLELPAYGLGNRRSIRLSYGVTPRNIRELARTVKSGNRRVLGRAATLPLGAPLEPG